jgi:hypothetical protein
MVAQRLGKLMYALFYVGRSNDFDRMASRVGVIGGIEKGRDATKMITMKMGDQEDIDLIA